MIQEFYNIGGEVYFINDEQKIVSGYITEIFYNARREANSDGFSSPFREAVYYVIDDQFRRNGKFVFKTKDELINSL